MAKGAVDSMAGASKFEHCVTETTTDSRLARQSPQRGVTSLAYHMDIEWLREAYRRTRKDGAVGVDGQTAADYEQDLEGNLQRLLNHAKSGTYRAPPVRRVHIPKAGSTSETRPIGIPTLEDKILQRAVVMLLEPIYETEFHEGSYGFRPRRSAHQALESLWQQTMANTEAGYWRWTSESSSTLWIMPTCGSFSGIGYATACCCASSASG